MASASTKEGSTRRLAELLNEQQEPFVLEIYLLERGYRIRKGLELEDRIFGCCSSNKNRIYKNNSNKQYLKNYMQFTGIARAVLSKLVWRKGRRTKGKGEAAVESAGRCSSASCSTTLSTNTWSESDTDGEIISMESPAKNQNNHEESAPNRLRTQWRFVGENKQCSPVSVLDEIDLLQAIPVYNVTQPHERTPAKSNRFQRKVSDEAILSASLWELLVQFRERPKQQGKRKPFPEYMNSKKALQQNRQLLFDCVREAVEMGSQQKSSCSSREKGLKMGPEGIGKIICQNLKVWGKLCADQTNIKQVLKMDLLEDEWGGFEVWKREIVAEIGNGIIDDITDQIISDMID